MIVEKSRTLFYYDAPRGALPVVMQELRDDPCRYCIQYAGGGHYFKTLEEMNEYLVKRFGLSPALEGV